MKQVRQNTVPTTLMGRTRSRLATDCTADEAAEFDVGELTCGYAREGIVSGPLDHMKIPDGGFGLTCVDADPADADPCTDGSDFTATMFVHFSGRDIGQYP